MTTTLHFRNTLTNGITGTDKYFDLITTAGASIDVFETDTVASGTEIQLTEDVAGDAPVVWITGRVPAGGFTLTTGDFSVGARETDMAANVGFRARLFKRSLLGIETELLGGPFDDGVEWTTSTALKDWTANPTDTAFVEDDRLIVKLYLTNIGTMGGGHQGQVSFNAASGAGLSTFIIAETVAFKAEDVTGMGALLSDARNRLVAA